MVIIRPALREYRTWTTDSRRWVLYEPRADDIIIGTSPKCGTTWMQQIVGSMVFQDPTPRPIGSMSPWIDGRAFGPAEVVHKNFAEQPHRRFPKSHLPLDGLPLYEQVRYIHVARDGRDTVLSMHNQYMAFTKLHTDRFDQIGAEDPLVGQPFPRIPTDPAEFFRLWISTPGVPGQTEGFPAPSFFDLEVSYWAERGRPNLLMVHYNDMLEDLDGEMRRIAEFVGIAVDESIWPSLVRAANFQKMRQAGSILMPQHHANFKGGADQFFHKGTIGGWRDTLTVDDLALYDAKVREKFTPGLAAWIACGRLVAGDPRESAS